MSDLNNWGFMEFLTKGFEEIHINVGGIKSLYVETAQDEGNIFAGIGLPTARDGILELTSGQFIRIQNSEWCYLALLTDYEVNLLKKIKGCDKND